MDLDRVSYDSGKYKHFREFYYELRGLVELKYPDGTAQNILDITTDTLLRKKVPSSVHHAYQKLQSLRGRGFEFHFSHQLSQ